MAQNGLLSLAFDAGVARHAGGARAGGLGLGVRTHGRHEGQVTHSAGVLQPFGKRGVQVHVDGAVLSQRQFGSASAHPQHAEAHRVGVSTCERVHHGLLQRQGLHVRHQTFHQLRPDPDPGWSAQGPPRDDDHAGELRASQQLCQQGLPHGA